MEKSEAKVYSISEAKLDEFNKSENKYQFFFNSFVELYELPEAAEEISKFLINELEQEKKKESYFTMLYDPDEFKIVHKEYATVAERNVAIDDYEALIAQTASIILREAVAVKFINENSNKKILVPTLKKEKYSKLVEELSKNAAEQKLYNAFAKGKNYDTYFNKSALTKYPLLANFMSDSLIAEIQNLKRSRKHEIKTFSLETKKQGIWSFGSFAVRNEFLSLIEEAINNRLEEILEATKATQPGNDNN